jgi:NhaP-type Na+/H+ or K+/H+ antiporter
MAATGDPAQSIALGLVLGAISSATAPAATTDVFWEYKARGPLTTNTFAIVALDDGLALVLYAIASGIATRLLSTTDHAGLAVSLLHIAYELLGAVALGVAAGVILNWGVHRLHDRGKALTLVVGT